MIQPMKRKNNIQITKMIKNFKEEFQKKKIINLNFKLISQKLENKNFILMIINLKVLINQMVVKFLLKVH